MNPRGWVLALVLGLAALAPARAGVPTLLPNGQQQFSDPNGAPYAGGSVYFYIPGTTTPKTTWQDPSESTANTNPVILNSAGRAIVWGEGQYREVLYDNFGNLVWDQVTYAVPTPSGAAGFGAQGSLLALATTDLGTITTNNVLVTSGAVITSFGASASTQAPVFLLEFGGASTLTYNATSMILPGGQSLVTAAGDTALAVYLGSGNWQVFQYTVQVNSPLAVGFGPQTSIASATTTDLSVAGSHNVLVTGTTTITGFGASASVSQPVFLLQFQGALTLTNSALLELPGGADISTLAGDSALVLYKGAGVWQVVQYTTGSVAPSGSQLFSKTFTANGAFSYTLPSTITTSTVLEFICQGPGGGAGSSSGGSGSGGGGGGSGAYADLMLSGFTPGSIISGSVGGTGGAGSTSSGSAGSPGNAPSKFTYSATDFLSCAPGLGGISGASGAAHAGGAGGTVSTNIGGAGLTLVNTVLSTPGQDGGVGNYAGNNVGLGGAGGGGPLGAGGQGRLSIASSAVTGSDGGGFGSGGGAGASGDNSQNTGGSGHPGIAIIRGGL